MITTWVDDYPRVRLPEGKSARLEIKEALMEMEEDMVAAYLIINETTYKGTDAMSVEPVVLFGNLQSAMDWLQDLAEDNDLTIEPDADSVSIPGGDRAGVEWDEYYIAEMELKD